jgi:uncharacterized protein YggE
MRGALAVALAVMATCAAAAAQPRAPSESILTVQGQGRAQVAPDHANMTADVVTKGKSLDAATAAHRERALRAAHALRELGSEGVEIERALFRLTELRPPEPPRPPARNEGEYQAVTSFELKLSQLDKVDGAVARIAASGLFELRNLRFGIGDRNPGLNAARRAAVADARERATIYAEAAGVELGDIIRIEDVDARSPRDVAAAAPMLRSMQVTPPEQLTLTASVTITWRIEPRR